MTQVERDPLAQVRSQTAAVIPAFNDEKRRPCRGDSRCHESINLFGKMLTIGIEKSHPRDFLIEPVP